MSVHASAARPRSQTPPLVSCLFPVLAAGIALQMSGCDTSSSGRSLSGNQAPEDSPRIAASSFVDTDGNGVDPGDVLLVRFDRSAIVQSDRTDGFALEHAGDRLGEGASLRQHLPGSAWVEIVVGTDPQLFPGAAGAAGVSRINVSEGGDGLIQVVGTNGLRAAAGRRSQDVVDVTGMPPELIETRFVNSDNEGPPGEGDVLLASFDQPILVPAGADVNDNFVLPVSGDSFGANPVLEAATSAVTNRTARILLGAGASLTPGDFDPANTAPGSPSGLEVAAIPTITDAVSGSGNTILPGAVRAVETPDSSLFGMGRDADNVQGALDAFTPGISAQTLQRPTGVEAVSGTLSVEGVDVDVDLLFVADRENDRVLVFENVLGGSLPAASWVLGQSAFTTFSTRDPVDTDARSASATTLAGPTDVAFDLATNRLYVSDTGNHRVLGWNELFSVDPQTARLRLENGRPADFVLGQQSFSQRQENQGKGQVSAGSLSSPAGLSVGAGRLAVADRGNHRVLVYGSLPDSFGATPGLVLGQPDFASAEPNRGGGAPGAGTLASPEDVFLSAAVSVNGSAGAILIADGGNHRALVFETLGPGIGADADVVLGQPDFVSSTPATSASGLSDPAGVTADTGGSGLLYVSDRGNHRIMIYDSAALANGQAGAALGQPDAVSGAPNRGAGPGQDTLHAPEGADVIGSALVVADSLNHRVMVYDGPAVPAADRGATAQIGQLSFATAHRNGGRLNRPRKALIVLGRLLVADTGNHRVLIYDRVPVRGDPDPDVVLGQADLFSSEPNRGGAPGADTLNLPTGIATDGTRLAVADTGNHRILIWNAIPAANGAPADAVLGQPDMLSSAANAGDRASAVGLHGPEGLFVADDRLLAADRRNHRVLVYGGFSALGTFAAAKIVYGQRDFAGYEENRGGRVTVESLSNPRDVVVAAGLLFVADTGNNRVLRWDRVYQRSGRGADDVIGQPDFVTGSPDGAGPQSLREPSGLAVDGAATRLVIADSSNSRVFVYAPLFGRSPTDREADIALGQRNLFEGETNGGRETPTFSTLASPGGLFFNGYELFVADTNNSRLVTYR